MKPSEENFKKFKYLEKKVDEFSSESSGNTREKFNKPLEENKDRLREEIEEQL